MKPSFVIALLFYTASSFSQKILIPFRSGTQFGLSDLNGKIIVSPQFDNVRWIQGSWFKSSKKIPLNDTLETAPGKFFIRNTTTTVSGLIHKGSIILKDEPFDEYEIIANKCIVAQYEMRPENLTKEQYKKYGASRKSISIFNLQGKNLYPENFRRIEKVDTTGISNKDKKSGRYILLVAMHFNNRYSMFVYDADQQKISEWLIKDAIKIEADRYQVKNKQIVFNITNTDYSNSSKLLDYTSGKFMLTAMPPEPVVNHSTDPDEKIDEVMISPEPGEYSVTVPFDREGDPEQRKRVFNPYHIIIKDTLYYLRNSINDKLRVNIAPGGKIITMHQRAVTQYQPLIVKSNDQFFIVKEDKLSTAAYDSLIYFGKYFLVWQNINGEIKAGVVDTDGKAVIPMEYDSLYPDIRYFELKDINRPGKSDYRIYLREADSKYSTNIYPYRRAFSGMLTVFKNGKCGIINLKGEMIVPLQYDLIARNNLQHIGPRNDEFVIVQQNNLYGIAHFKYAKGKNTPDFNLTVSPNFEFIPGFFYEDYYGVKDFTLVGLYDSQYQFKGYADINGKKYYKD